MIRLYIVLLFSVFSTGFSWAEGVSPGVTRVIETKVIRNDYFEAEIDITINLAGDAANAAITIPRISESFVPNSLQNGLNKIRVIVCRNENKDRSVRSDSIRVQIYNDKENLYDETAWVSIEWPGPEIAQQYTKGEVVKMGDFSSISKVNINRYINAEVIIKKLLLAGLPIEKIVKFGREDIDPRTYNLGRTLSIGREVNIGAMRMVTSVVLDSEDLIKAISIPESGAQGLTAVSIGSYVLGKKIDDSYRKKLIKSDISDSEFYQYLGYTPPKTEDIIKRKYESSVTLIDIGNVKMAKQLIDEVIQLQPDFAPIYLELARYQMKTMKTDASLKAAEKTIRIALDIDQELADAHVLMGYVYTNQGRFDEAEKEYVLSEKLGTDNLWLYANWGLNYEKQNIVKKSIEKYMLVVTAKNISEKNIMPRAWVFRYSKIFKFLLYENQYELANKLYSTYDSEYVTYMTSSDSDKCILQDQSAIYLYFMNDYERAIESYLKSRKQSCKVDNHVLPIAYYVKWHDFEKKKSGSSEAISIFRQAESYALSDEIVLYLLATSPYTSPVIKGLISKGKNIDFIGDEGTTALFLTIINGNHKAAKELIRIGADVNMVVGEEKVTPIFLAVYRHDLEMVKILVSNGADPNIQVGGASILDLANSTGANDIAEYLESLPTQRL